jgi:hypothetical protein
MLWGARSLGAQLTQGVSLASALTFRFCVFSLRPFFLCCLMVRRNQQPRPWSLSIFLV